MSATVRIDLPEGCRTCCSPASREVTPGDPAERRCCPKAAEQLLRETRFVRILAMVCEIDQTWPNAAMCGPTWAVVGRKRPQVATLPYSASTTPPASRGLRCKPRVAIRANPQAAIRAASNDPGARGAQTPPAVLLPPQRRHRHGADMTQVPRRALLRHRMQARATRAAGSDDRNNCPRRSERRLPPVASLSLRVAAQVKWRHSPSRGRTCTRRLQALLHRPRRSVVASIRPPGHMHPLVSASEAGELRGNAEGRKAIIRQRKPNAPGRVRATDAQVPASLRPPPPCRTTSHVLIQSIR